MPANAMSGRGLEVGSNYAITKPRRADQFKSDRPLVGVLEPA